jgi:hypothetical protein
LTITNLLNPKPSDFLRMAAISEVLLLTGAIDTEQNGQTAPEDVANGETAFPGKPFGKRNKEIPDRYD